MGYTHYWKQQRDFTDTEWDSTRNALQKLADVSEVELTGADGEKDTPIQNDEDAIMFNGVGDDSHETCAFDKIMRSDFDFCKTAQKPYDEVVVALLIFILNEAKGVMEISSDGDMDGVDWDAGRQLLAKIK